MEMKIKESEDLHKAKFREMSKFIAKCKKKWNQKQKKQNDGELWREDFMSLCRLGIFSEQKKNVGKGKVCVSRY